MIRIYLLILIAIFNLKVSVGQAVLNYFTANQSSYSIELTWESASENNIDYYSIQRSLDSINFFVVGNISAVGNSSSPVSYSLTDNSQFVDTTYYYRLKNTDFNGAYSYSDTIKILYNSSVTTVKELKVNLFSKIYPNPTTDEITIQIETGARMQEPRIEVYDAVGKKVKEVSEIKENEVKISLVNVNKGIYFVKLKDKKGKEYSAEKIILN